MKKISIGIFILLALFFCVSSTALAEEDNMKNGIELFYQKNWDGAITEFRNALTKEPNNTMAISFLLDCYAKKNAIIDISNEFEKNALENGQDAVAQTYLGMAYFTKSLLDASIQDEAIQQFKQAIKLDPNFSMAHAGLGMVYFQKRMIPRASGHFLKAIQLNPKDTLALELMGNILLVDEKKPDSALDYFNKIAEIYPYYPDVFYYIGSSCYDLEKYDEAISSLEKALQLDPAGITQGYYAPVLLGDLYLKLKKYPEAQAAYKKALEINPQNSYAKYKLEKAQKPEK